MRLFFLLAIVIVMTCLPTVAQSTGSGNALKTPRTASDKKLEREILKAENLLGHAIAKRDVTSLDKLLTDYYADAYEGSERAANKKATLARCKEGSLHFYRVKEKRTVTVSVDIVTVEGIAAGSAQKESEDEKAATVHVKRLWTKKGGRWQLVGQTLGSADQDHRE
jgi:hypothetical protein